MTTLTLSGKRLSGETTSARRQPGRMEHCPVCVIVPARNEGETIYATLAALRAQTGIDHSRVEVIVLANNCDDDTGDQVRLFASSNPGLNLQVYEKQFPEESANIGNARRWLMDLAAQRLPANGIIASTDGDTVADPLWLAATLREFERGVEFVGGRIVTSVSQAPHSPVRRVYLQDTAYRLLVAEVEALLDPDPCDPWPRHFQHYGASLAITCSAYLGIGGLPDVPVLEDMALYDELRRHDVAIRHSPWVRVTTSARMSGRAGMGLSTQLSEWQTMIDAGREPLVESAAYVIARIRERNRLRTVWKEGPSRNNAVSCGRHIETGLDAFSPSVDHLDTLSGALRQLRMALIDLRRAPAIYIRSSRSSRYVSA